MYDLSLGKHVGSAGFILLYRDWYVAHLFGRSMQLRVAIGAIAIERIPSARPWCVHFRTADAFVDE